MRPGGWALSSQNMVSAAGAKIKNFGAHRCFTFSRFFLKKKKKKKRKIVVGVGWDFGSHLVTIRFRERKLFHLCENICTRVYILFHLCVGSSRNNRLIYRRHISKKKKSRRRVRVSTKPNCFTKCFLLSIFFFFFFVFFFSSNYKWIRFVFVWFYFYIFIWLLFTLDSKGEVGYNKWLFDYQLASITIAGPTTKKKTGESLPTFFFLYPETSNENFSPPPTPLEKKKLISLFSYRFSYKFINFFPI